MSSKTPVMLSGPELKLEIHPEDLACHVTVASTGETLRMAAGQADDVLMVSEDRERWQGFSDGPIRVTKRSERSMVAVLPALGLVVEIILDGADVIFTVSPTTQTRGAEPREVLYPRHFLLPVTADAYATFPLGQGSIIPANYPGRFHHREGYSEAVAHWIGGWTGNTGYVAIAETPDDLYQAVDHTEGQAPSCFIHWLGSLGRLRYARRVRYRFGADLTWVAQAKAYREHCRVMGLFRTLKDKAEENPNINKLRGALITPAAICMRRERTMDIETTPFATVAERYEDFRKTTGIEKAVAHIDGWGYWGYDAMHPDALPPNGEAGGVAGLGDLARRVKELDYLFLLHDQYIDYYHHAPSFDERLSIHTEDGRPVRVNRWCGGICGHLTYREIPRFVRRNYYEGVRRVYPIYHNSPSIWEICKPTASYLDCFCRTVEDFCPDHPMTRSDARRYMNEIFQIVRNGQDDQRVVLSVEHPRDYALPYLDFGWSLGHLATDVPTTVGEMDYKAVGIPVPLWHLAFHDAVTIPAPRTGDLLEPLLYGQAPYFFLGRETVDEETLRPRRVLLALHDDIGFAEMSDHQLLEEDGSVRRSVFDNGLEVEVNYREGTYRISDGLAKTDGWVTLQS